jgi:SAM-dependent methyltransferase
MNRKERRAAKRSGAQLAPRSFGNGAPADLGASLLRSAANYHRSGALAEAKRAYRQLLALFPAHADAHSRLGAVLIAQERASEAIPHIQRAVALNPTLFEAYGNLAQAYSWTAQRKDAIDAACRALELKETPQSKAIFGQCVVFARFTADSERFRKLLLRALTEGWVRPRELTSACISLIKQNPVVREAIGAVDAAWPQRLSDGKMFGAHGTIALAQDRLLCSLLERDPVTDISLERLLTNVRSGVLSVAEHTAADEALLAFYCAVARQCFINEYIFAIGEDEAARLQRMRAVLEAALASGDSIPAMHLVAAAAYFPLHRLAHCGRLLERSWPAPVHELLVQQVKEPIEERRIAATMPALTGIDDEVSRAVRGQYEESPYPRWVQTGPAAQPPVFFQPTQAHTADVLIAGCGTGLSTIEFAQQARQVRILAIDLSLASLSYAKRMALALGIANLEFAQADILQLGSLTRQFDFIDCSGVLHHLADPWQGWRVLLSLLRPGGTMQIGLYSRLARRNITASRALIAERGYRPTADDIRRCRQEIVAADDRPLTSVIQWSDFFTTNECRDLLFHVQEHQITIPQIKDFLAANNLEFTGFVLTPPMRHNFALRFPEPRALTDLDCWDAFEQAAPDTFGAMYQFSVRKPALS